MYNIELKVKEVVIKDGENKGNTFNCYKVLTKNKKWVDCRFTKDVKNIPNEDSIIEVEESAINYDKNRQFPCFWIRAIVNVKPIERVSGKDLGVFFE